MSTRKDSETLEDPLYKAIESELDSIINSKETSIIVLDWALLPKTKYFQMCDYNILLLPVNDVKRKEAVLKRDNLQDTTRLDRRDRYGVDYRNYKFDKIVINQYDSKQFAVLKRSILEELETSKSEDTKEGEKDFIK